MKLASAVFFLSKILRYHKLQQGGLFKMVNNVDERAIYAELARRWMGWTGKRWINVTLIR